jgi:(S)-sulfolactate dehydrogenase
MKVLLSEAVNAPLDALRELDIDAREELWRDRRSLIEAVATCDGLVVRNQTRVDSELIAAAPRLRAVGRLGAGLDNIDLDALRERNVTVIHGGGFNARAVAEYVIGACFTLARRLAMSDREVRAGGWQRHVGLELSGEPLGIVGLGATGAETARLGRAVGFRVAGYDPYLDPPEGVDKLELDLLLCQSQFLSLHVPLTRSTRGMISGRELALLPSGAFLINAARGGVVDEGALLASLESGHLAGAALDVRTVEPPGTDDSLAGLDNVLLTAHLAGLTQQSQSAIAAHVLDGVRRALLGH